MFRAGTLGGLRSNVGIKVSYSSVIEQPMLYLITHSVVWCLCNTNDQDFLLSIEILTFGPLKGQCHENFVLTETVGA